MRRNQRLLAGENQIGTLCRRSLLMTSSISTFLGNWRPVGGSAKVIAMGDTGNGCAVTGHSHQESAQKSVVRQELMLAARQAPQPCEAGLAKGKSG